MVSNFTTINKSVSFKDRDNFEKYMEAFIKVNDLITMDAHFWVVRNGEIVDTYFEEYDMIKRANGVNPNEPVIHCPASPEIQEMLISFIRQTLIDEFGSMEDFALANEMFFDGEARQGHCQINSFYEAFKRGGQIVMGSWGFKKQGKMWWEYGGKDWDTPMAFVKNPQTKRLTKIQWGGVAVAKPVFTAEEIAEKKRLADAEWDIEINIAVKKSANNKKKSANNKKKK